MRYIITLLATLCIACSVTSPLHRRATTARLSQLNTLEREMMHDTATPRLTTIDHAGRRFNILHSEVVDGEQMGVVDIAQVRVVSKMRTIAERGGEVTLDFVVTIPKELLGRSRNVTITPELHDERGTTPLEELTIRGALIDKIQRRDEWQYSTYLARYSPSASAAERMYSRLVKFPRPADARLDSLVEGSRHITYYYSQSITTDEQTKRLKVTLNGRVAGVDNTIYNMPASDTISYSVSSMLSFLDLTPRFQLKIIDKYITVSDTRHISYPAGSSEIIETLANNRSELQKINTLLREITKQDEFHVDTITLTATSSPEGSYSLNSRLAERRAHALRSYIGESVRSSITTRWIAEDWSALRALILRDTQITHRTAILHIIDSERHADRREALIKSRHAADYAYIRRELYPHLRAVTLRYSLRRKGMVKDTLQTTTLDTLYARGVHLLQQRRYPEALYILAPYRDRNTIIAHLSMAHDDEALHLLERQPPSATTHYLQAIALARLGRTTEAHDAYKRACDEEPRMAFRANLDPEITKLLKQ